MANTNLKKSISPEEMQMLKDINIFDSYDPSLLLQQSQNTDVDFVNKLLQQPMPKDALDIGVEAYEENVPLLTQIGIGLTPAGYGEDIAGFTKYTRDAMRHGSRGETGAGLRSAGLASLHAIGLIPVAGDLAKGLLKPLLKGKEKISNKVLNARAKFNLPKKGKPTFEANLRKKNPRLEKELDKVMTFQHQGHYKNWDEMFEVAKEANKPFQKDITKIAESHGKKTTTNPGEANWQHDKEFKKYVKYDEFGQPFDIRTGAFPGTVKTTISALRKAGKKYDDDFTRITDPIRTRIVVETVEESDKIAKEIANKFPTKDSGNQMNQFGFKDRKLNIQYTTPDGKNIIGEISIVPRAMGDASIITHPMYDTWRVLGTNFPTGDIPLIAKHDILNLKRMQKSIFKNANAKLDVSWQSDDIIKKFDTYDLLDDVIKFAEGGAVYGNSGTFLPITPKLVSNSDFSMGIPSITMSANWSPDAFVHSELSSDTKKPLDTPSSGKEPIIAGSKSQEKYNTSSISNIINGSNHKSIDKPLMGNKKEFL